MPKRSDRPPSVIVETMKDFHKLTPIEARRRVAAMRGAKFIDEAIRDNPDGPVQMVTTLSRTEIDYEVVVGGVEVGDHGRARTVWTKTVTFGATDRTVAGGADFRQAALDQEAVALAMLELMEASR